MLKPKPNRSAAVLSVAVLLAASAALADTKVKSPVLEGTGVDSAIRIERGCKVKVHDPVALERFGREHGHLGAVCCESPEQVVEEADALVLVTEWQQYRELDWESLTSRMRFPIVLDGRNALDRARLTRYGFRYLSLA